MGEIYVYDPETEENVPIPAREPGGGLKVPGHDVLALPGTVEPDIAAIKAFLLTLAGIVTSGRAAVDLPSTINTYLQTLANAVTSNRVAVDLTGTVTTYLSNLPTLVANQAPPSAIYGGKKTVTTAGTNVQLQAASQPLTEGVLLRALDANTGLVYPGNSSVTSAGNGSRMAAREPCFIRIDNVNKVYIDAAVNGEGVTFLAW
jgi:hypothetical protein